MCENDESIYFSGLQFFPKIERNSSPPYFTTYVLGHLGLNTLDDRRVSWKSSGWISAFPSSLSSRTKIFPPLWVVADPHSLGTGGDPDRQNLLSGAGNFANPFPQLPSCPEIKTIMLLDVENYNLTFFFWFHRIECNQNKKS